MTLLISSDTTDLDSDLESYDEAGHDIDPRAAIDAELAAEWLQPHVLRGRQELRNPKLSAVVACGADKSSPVVTYGIPVLTSTRMCRNAGSVPVK